MMLNHAKIGYGFVLFYQFQMRYHLLLEQERSRINSSPALQVEVKE